MIWDKSRMPAVADGSLVEEVYGIDEDFCRRPAGKGPNLQPAWLDAQHNCAHQNLVRFACGTAFELFLLGLVIRFPARHVYALNPILGGYLVSAAVLVKISVGLTVRANRGSPLREIGINTWNER